MSTTPLSAELHNSYVNEANAYVAGFISLISNFALIYATSKVKTYSNAFRWIQYYVCVLRLLFSMVVVLTSPTLVYVAKMKSLYIVKGGFFLPFNVGTFFLTLFVFFVVISCSSPTVQYLQLVHILSDSSHKRENFGPIMSTVSVFAGIPTLILVYFGYTPSIAEQLEAKDIVYYLNGEGDSAFLMITAVRNDYIDWHSIFCTNYIMIIMILSVITVLVCGIKIQKQMRKKMMSDVAKKSQIQINWILFLQFALPFFTVHVPFYVSFILPMFDIENSFLSTNLPFLFSWCPAINPILVIIVVKNVRDRLICKSTASKVCSSNMIQVRQTSQVLSARVH